MFGQGGVQDLDVAGRAAGQTDVGHQPARLRLCPATVAQTIQDPIHVGAGPSVVGKGDAVEIVTLAVPAATAPSGRGRGGRGNP